MYTCVVSLHYRKPKLLSRDDLVLPWQPLFTLVKEVFYSKQQQLGIVLYSKYVCSCVYICVYIYVFVYMCIYVFVYCIAGIYCESFNLANFAILNVLAKIKASTHF